MGPRVDADEPIGWPGLVTVKASTVRTVLRGVADGVDVHVKLYRAVRLTDRARDAIGGSRGAKELRNLREAWRRGLPCVEPLCAGRWNGSFGTRSFLITRTEPDAEPLGPWPWPAADARAVGALLRQAHDAGLLALDLHAGNVLRRRDGTLVLLDLTSASLSEPLQSDDRANALAFFCADLDGGVRDPGAAALVDAYGAEERLLARAERAGRRLRSQRLSAFGRRAMRACRHTAIEPESDGRGRWFLHRPAAALHEAARAWSSTPSEPDKHGRRGAVWVGDDLVVKRRPSAAAQRLFRAAYWLIHAGARCAEPVAMRLRHGDGLVFARRVPSPNLRTELADGTLDASQLVTAARSLGRSVGRMHAFGLRNRDLKLENLARDPDTGELVMVDLDGVRRKAPLDRRGLAADLGRLLAAWQDADPPSHARVVRAFWGEYHRARRWLRSMPKNDLRRRSEARAREWAQRHRTGQSRSDAG